MPFRPLPPFGARFRSHLSTGSSTRVTRGARARSGSRSPHFSRHGQRRFIAFGVSDLRRARYDVALDLQGLLKSAVLARLSGAARVIGFPPDLLRERAARFFYTETAGDLAPHVIDKNLSMLKAVGIRMPENRVSARRP